jgi:hypothetical protein
MRGGIKNQEYRMRNEQEIRAWALPDILYSVFFIPFLVPPQQPTTKPFWSNS